MKLKLGLRAKPDDEIYAGYGAYKFRFFPALTLWGFNTRVYTWLFWELEITGINKGKFKRIKP